jgi:hypothetical protein
MSQGQVPVKPRVWRMLVVIGLFILGTIYATFLISTRDPFFFLSGFDTLPDRVVVYHAGQQTEYLPGQPGFDLLAESIRSSLDQGVARQTGVGMGEQTQKDAYEKFLTVEAFFNQPVKLHANFNTGNPTRMLFPITGRHSELSVIFLAGGGDYMSNGPALKNLQPLRDALAALGYQ